MEANIINSQARIRLISMFFIRLANDYWVNIYTMKNDAFKRYYWGDVNAAFSSFWRSVSRDNDKTTEDAICELVDTTYDKVMYIYTNVFNAMAKNVRRDDLELCVKVYIFDIFLTAGRAFAEAMEDVKNCRRVDAIRAAVAKFMGGFKFPYQDDDRSSVIYKGIEPYLLQFIEFLKTVQIRVKDAK